MTLETLLAGALAPDLARESVGIMVVDIQGDFTTWKNGSLAVEGADRAYVGRIEAVTRELKEKGYPVYATQDWHPEDHISFFTNHEGRNPFDTIEINGKTQVLWPPHCVQHAEGAKILLDETLFRAIVRKGKERNFDSYSGFRDDGGTDTEMDQVLKKDGIKVIVLFGLAFDYCVRATAVDAIRAGYKVIVIEGLSPAIAPDTAARAAEEMKEAGVILRKEL